MNHGSHESNRGFAALWAWPIALALVSGIGLVSALFSDGGFGDTLAAVCLTVPVVVGIWFGWLRRAKGQDTSA